MTSESFCYWLMGLFELGKPTTLDAEQTQLIKRHLDMVFLHEIDPALGTPEHVEKLRQLHEGLEAMKKGLANKSPADHSHPQPFDRDRRLTC